MWAKLFWFIILSVIVGVPAAAGFVMIWVIFDVLKPKRVRRPVEYYKYDFDNRRYYM